MTTNIVREMNETELAARVIGQAWDAVTQDLDWIDYYPLVDSEGFIVGVVDANGQEPEDADFDESAECYRQA